jgi:hypothetical protein
MTVNDTEIPLQNHNKPTFKVDYIPLPVVIEKTELKIGQFSCKLTVTFVKSWRHCPTLAQRDLRELTRNRTR